jgi:sugar lactone lactonase YvrE
MEQIATIVAAGFGYLEGARWHGDALYFSDIKARRVVRMQADGRHRSVCTLASRPSGLGWSIDGDLLVVGMEDETLNRFSTQGALPSRIDLSAHIIHANDMAVDSQGRAYISHFGYHLFNNAPPTATHIVMVESDGKVTRFGEGMLFPNGVALSPDERTLVVAESFGRRLTVFDRAADGSLSRQRVFAQFDNISHNNLDGICFDRDGAVWAGVPFAGEFWRIVEGGEITDCVKPAPGSGSFCVAPALGGEDGKTLFLLVADTTAERVANDFDSTASVQSVRVAVPGV